MRIRSVLPFFGLLALLHLYIGWRLSPGFAASAPVACAGVALLLVVLLLVPLGLLSRAVVQQPLSDRLAWIGLLAMGFLSSLLVLTVARDVLLWPVRLFMPDSAQVIRASAQAVPLLALLTSLVGLFNARRVAQVVEVIIRVQDLPPALEGFTLVQLSDLHVGPTIKRPYLDAIVDVVNRLNADVVAITGDLVDGSVAALAVHTAPLARLRAVHGAYVVTGNHEYYSGATAWIAELRRLGLTVLLNQHVLLRRGAHQVLLAGVTDFGGHHFDESHRSDPAAAIAGAPHDVAVRILLAHQPRSAPAAADAGFDLQLSGHTHGGQFFPWNLFVPLQQPYTAGLNRLRNLWVYTSRGTGYWGPPKRVGAPSEITHVRLTAA